MDGSTGGGFNTFGFLSMMIAGFNLVGLISNNGNQNNDNNINRNNDNNNNNQQVNMANTPSEFMTNNMIIAPPLPGRMLDVEIKEPIKLQGGSRKKRDVCRLN
ncbi:ras-related protein RabX [Eurytemora carolleeae]|uniref:ras-related protein RabX n=1 Tax=Eurytemora carolleeae TaxID=1294199 RepID=UPI000C782F7B|nr:ras-related protein RabX [Eurytemora carolleeae]|eukprot:XP_023333967.1 ras-related protein RabX-like [Eurytemora affinis]